VSVTVGGKDCPVTSHQQTAVECTLPAGTGAAVDVVLKRGGTPTAAKPFSYLPPNIGTITPSAIATKGGVLLTISGQNFGSSAARVDVGTAACPISSQTDSEIICASPEGNPGTA